MFSLNGTLKKNWVGRAMGNETIYWDGLWNQIIVASRIFQSRIFSVSDFQSQILVGLGFF